MTYGAEPVIATKLNVDHKFGTYLLYMPVKMAGSLYKDWGYLKLPPGLENLRYVVSICASDALDILPNLTDKYIYLSFETSYVKKGVPQKRPGWHCDGFQTDDINYLWYSAYPTIFSRTQFKIDQNHSISMEQFEQQAKEEDSFTIESGTLIRVNQYVVHKAAIPEFDSIRTFLKVSISSDKYNLKGNTHNPMFDYDWKMYDRGLVRNHPQIKEVDSVPEGVLL